MQLIAPPPFAMAMAAPVIHALALGVAVQAADSLHAAIMMLTLVSISSISLLNAAQAIQKGEIYIGPDSDCLNSGTLLGKYENTQSGVMVVGLTVAQSTSSIISFLLPKGWFYGVKQTVGSNLTVPSVTEMAIV